MPSLVIGSSDEQQHRGWKGKREVVDVKKLIGCWITQSAMTLQYIEGGGLILVENLSKM
jgi:hypothetical protein